jgi:hypothetical protein
MLLKYLNHSFRYERRFAIIKHYFDFITVLKSLESDDLGLKHTKLIASYQTVTSGMFK